jgi:hypothetical protein
LIKQIESQNFKLLLQVAGTTIEGAAKARDAKRREIETDVLNGSIDGYGLIVLTASPSGTICATVATNRGGHEAVIQSLSDHLIGVIGATPAAPTFTSSVDEAFSAVQHGTCAAVYASATDLKALLAALKREAIAYQIDENWVTQAQVDDAQSRSQQNQSLQDQQNLDRQRQQAEERSMQALREQDLAKTKAAQQAALQDRYGSTAEAAAAAVANEVKGFTDSGGNDQNVASRFPAFADWYQRMLKDHWELISFNSDLLDYGQVNWKDRTLESSLAKVSLKLRNLPLGVYQDACFVFGYVLDGEFGVSRDPISAACDDGEALDSWKRSHAFQSQWIVG